MYKTRNTVTGNRIRGTWEMGRMLHSGECPQKFRGMSPNSPANVLKRQTFRGMSSNIPGNVAKHSGECCQTFWGMSPNYSGEYPQTFRGMSVLLKEMKTQAQSKISSCCFCVWCKPRELGGRGVQDFPSGGKLPLRPSLSYS